MVIPSLGVVVKIWLETPRLCLFPKLRICFADFPVTYFVLSTRGYKPWRPDAVMGTTRGVNKSVLQLSRDGVPSLVGSNIVGNPEMGYALVNGKEENLRCPCGSI